MDNVVINITEIQDNVQITLNECITEVVTDGVTVTGNGTISNPLSAVVGSGDMLRATYDPTNKNADAFSMENMVEGATKKILTSAERTKLNNLSGTNTGDQDLTPYLTSATAAATYQPIGAYLTTISGLNISQLTNDSGYITSAALNGKVDENAAITGATKTKITYDSKGLVTSGADATTADIADSTNKRYVTDANLVVIGNTSGTNTGDNATNSQYSGLAASKQDTLVSGTNIKTINSNSLLGSGDLVITAGDGNDDFMLVASFKSLYNY